MADDGTELAVQFLVAHVRVVHIATRKGARDIDAVRLRVVGAIHLVRKHGPLALVDRLGELPDIALAQVF